MTVTEFIQQLMGVTEYPIREIKLTGKLSENVPYDGEGGGFGMFTYSRKLGKCDHWEVCFALMVSECRDLEVLMLHDQALSFKCLDYIAMIVKKNIHLRILNLEGNQFRWNNRYSFDVKYYFRSILSSTSLEEVNVRQCGLSDAMLMTLAELLSVNNTLKKLYIGRSGHQYSLEAFEAFVVELEKNTSLVECDIDIWTIHFQRHDRVKKRLGHILERNRQQPQNFSTSQSMIPASSSSTSSTSTSTSSSTFFSSSTSNSISKVGKSNTQERLPEIVAKWERDLFSYAHMHKLPYNKAEIINYIVIALKALCNQKWNEIIRKPTKTEIPKELISVLNNFVEDHPILLHVYQSSTEVEKICDDLLEIIPAVDYIESEIIRLTNRLVDDLRDHTFTATSQFQQKYNLPSLRIDTVQEWVVAVLQNFDKESPWINEPINKYGFLDIRHSFRFINDEALLHSITREPVRLKRLCDNLLINPYTNLQSQTLSSNSRPNIPQQLINVAEAWVNMFVSKEYSREDATHYVISALQALRHRDWNQLSDHSEKVTTLLINFARENSILLEASNYPGVIKKICDDLLEALEESELVTADTSYSSSRSLN